MAKNSSRYSVGFSASSVHGGVLLGKRFFMLSSHEAGNCTTAYSTGDRSQRIQSVQLERLTVLTNSSYGRRGLLASALRRRMTKARERRRQWLVAVGSIGLLLLDASS